MKRLAFAPAAAALGLVNSTSLANSKETAI